MCYFRLHFSDVHVIFSKKACCSLLLKKITCCVKREKTITCCEEKFQPPTPPPPNIKWSVPLRDLQQQLNEPIDTYVNLLEV